MGECHSHNPQCYCCKTRAFTDGDWERSTEIFSKPHPGKYDGPESDRYMGCCSVCGAEPKIHALLASLEAAERAIKADYACENFARSHNEPPCNCGELQRKLLDETVEAGNA